MNYMHASDGDPAALRSATTDSGSRAPAVLPAARICLFLDFDGTLVEFADQPHAVQADPALVALLRSLQVALDGALALISGRRIDELDVLLQPLRLPTAGLHGMERRDARGRLLLARPEPDARLLALRAPLLELVARHPGLLLEDKLAALALHYRRAPELAEIAEQAIETLLEPLRPHYEVMRGDRVLEIKPADRDKATAVEAFMREEPFAGRRPVYVGDDLTDSDGFSAVRRFDGVSVAVGDRVNAQWRLADPSAVRSWLAALATGSGSRS